MGEGHRTNMVQDPGDWLSLPLAGLHRGRRLLHGGETQGKNRASLRIVAARDKSLMFLHDAVGGT